MMFHLGLNYDSDSFIVAVDDNDCKYKTFFKSSTGEPVVLDSNELNFNYMVND